MLAFPPAIQPAHRTALEALAADLRTEFDDLDEPVTEFTEFTELTEDTVRAPGKPEARA